MAFAIQRYVSSQEQGSTHSLEPVDVKANSHTILPQELIGDVLQIVMLACLAPTPLASSSNRLA